VKTDNDNKLTTISQDPPVEGDRAAGIQTTERFCRFPQRDDMFNRAFWDDDVHRPEMMEFFESYRVAPVFRRADGFTQKDFALRNAAWAVSDEFSSRGESEGIREGFNALLQPTAEPATTQVDVDDPDAMAAEIKRVAKLFGAGIVGIAPFDQRWTYATRADSKTFEARETGLPGGMTSVIVLGHEMDIDMVATYPSAIAGAATGNAYSEEVSTVTRLSQYIRNLGWQAAGSMNDTALVIPYALQAGLGEYARNQLVITPEFGPRVRFSKIFTDLPLAHDGPRMLGVRSFCDICTRCINACPVKALPSGSPTEKQPNRSAIRGVVKWTSDAEKCFSFWTDLRSDCAICLRVCPWNRDFGKWPNRVWRWLAGTRVRHLLIWLENITGRGKRQRSARWWTRGIPPI
jgi:reductive dehalogenase